MKKNLYLLLKLTIVMLIAQSCVKEKKTSINTSNGTNNSATVTDVDGNVYNTVTICGQVWMKGNLRVTKYRNGDIIGTTSAGTSGESTPKYQWPSDGNESNVSIYGRFYTYYVVTDSRGIAPAGWHIPSQSEWETLVTCLGGDYSLIGGILKETGTTHWQSPNNASNTYSFTALPAGYRNYSTFNLFGQLAAYWSTTATTSTEAYTPYVYNNSTTLLTNGSTKNYGYSVRCIKD